MAGEQLRWGILGCGKISGDFVRALKHCVNHNEVVAVATSSSLERAQDFRKSLKLASTVKFYGSYQDLLNDADVDVVYVGNLNDAHCEWTIKALEANKHVLCEKPLGVNVLEVQKMVDKAREKKRFLMEAFWSRFFPAWKYIREVINSGKYGKAQLSSVNFGVLLPKDRLVVSTCETPVLDIGVYTVTFSLFVFSKKPKAIHVVGGKYENGSDKWANFVLEFDDETRALGYFDSSNVPANSAFISFEKGQIQIPDFFWAPTRLIEFNIPVRANSFKPKELKFPLHDEEDAAEYFYNNSSGLHYEADHVFECIKQGKTESDVMSLDESVRLHEIIEEIRHKLGVVFKQDKA